MSSRSDSRLSGQGNKSEVEVLLREYDNLTQHIRTFVTGQYTLATIGVAFVLGLLGAVVNWGRYVMLIPLPTSFLFVACVIGLQLAMMHYLDRHLGALEGRINRLCSAGQLPLLTWYTRYSFPHLGYEPRDPMFRWVVAIYVLAGIMFVGLLGAGAWAIVYLVPDDSWGWGAVGAVFYLLGHLGLAGFIVGTLKGAGDLAAETYGAMEARGAPARGLTRRDTAGEA